MFLLLLCFSLFLSSTNASWTQQYGDPASINYIPITSNSLHIKTGWNYSVPFEHGWGAASIFYNSPAVSDKGVVFIPYLKYPEYWLQVRSVSPDGKELWLANWIGSDIACSAVFMTNTIYDSNRDMVIVGWFCPMTFEYEKAGQLVALNATNGSIIWRTSKLKPGNDMSYISMSSDTIFLSSGYSCGRDAPRNAYLQSIPQAHNELTDQKNKSRIIAVDLETGKISWSLVEHHAGCYTQTKVTSLKDGSSLVMFPVNLPPGRYPTGDLLTFICSTSSLNCNQTWLYNLKISYDAKFAFSDNGIMFGSYGFAGNPDLIFAVDIENNKILFSNRGYCGSNAYPSGPAVDKQGHAYYR